MKFYAINSENTVAKRVSFDVTAEKVITVAHNYGVPPIAYFLDEAGGPAEMLDPVHNEDFTEFTITSAVALTGTIYII